MKKLFMVLCIVIMFFGIVGCPSSDDPATTSSFKSTTSTSVATSGTVEQIGVDDNFRWFPGPRACYTYTAWLRPGRSCRGWTGKNSLRRKIRLEKKQHPY